MIASLHPCITKDLNILCADRSPHPTGKKPAEKVFYDIAPKYKDRKGGYLRIIKTSDVRRRDAAKKAVIEFI